MLTNKQVKFTNDFLHPLKQRFFFLRQLPMALLAGVKLVALDEEKAIATVPFKPRNKNPFKSMYFAVQSMAAELSTAAPPMLALRGMDANVALIIVKNEAFYFKKATTKITFTCTDYKKYADALAQLKNGGDTAEVTAIAKGTDEHGVEVAEFRFTWSFKRRT
jgi:acyl-coenzyme A thioesterase PaaI-like protein